MQGITPPMSSFPHSHRRKHSDELDVFEATRYFSSASVTGETTASHRAMRTERKSLDIPIEHKVIFPQRVDQLNRAKEKIKHKQPSSPGRKLASFLNSFFQQYSASKSKKKNRSSKPMTTTKGNDIQEERKRSSSISDHYSQSNNTSTSTNKSCYYSSSSSCSTPSLHSKKREDEFRSKMRQEHEHVLINSNKLDRVEKKAFLFSKKDHEKPVNRDDDGDQESDSSSDLFELKINYEFGASELPVFGSTDMGVIRTRVDGFATSTTVAY